MNNLLDETVVVRKLGVDGVWHCGVIGNGRVQIRGVIFCRLIYENYPLQRGHGSSDVGSSINHKADSATSPSLASYRFLFEGGNLCAQDHRGFDKLLYQHVLLVELVCVSRVPCFHVVDREKKDVVIRQVIEIRDFKVFPKQIN